MPFDIATVLRASCLICQERISRSLPLPPKGARQELIEGQIRHRASRRPALSLDKWHRTQAHRHKACVKTKTRCRVAQRDAPVASHVHNRGVKRLQVGPIRRKCGKIDVLCLALGQKLSTVRPAPANYLCGVATDPIAEPFDYHVERIGHRSVHGRYPRKLADGKRNAFGKFRLHKLRELAHNVAVVIELDGADLDNLITQPTSLALLWHRRKLKVQHNLARKVRRIDSRDTRRLFS